MTTSGKRYGLAGFAAKVAEHGNAEEGVGAGLVALSLAAKPGDDVGVEPEGKLLLYGAIEGIADSGLTERFFATLRMTEWGLRVTERGAGRRDRRGSSLRSE